MLIKLICFIPKGKRRYYTDQQSGRQLVRGLCERQDRLFPHQLRAGQRAAT